MSMPPILDAIRKILLFSAISVVIGCGGGTQTTSVASQTASPYAWLSGEVQDA
jgi:hypothetical protein